MLSPYWPGSSRPAGKLKRPLSSVGTLTVTVEPAFLALTTTPSMAPSLSDVTRPVSAALCAKAGTDSRQHATRLKAATFASRRMTISPHASSLCVGASIGFGAHRDNQVRPANAAVAARKAPTLRPSGSLDIQFLDYPGEEFAWLAFACRGHSNDPGGPIRPP